MNKAFTLVELLISSAIALLVMGFFVQQISYASKVHIDNNMIRATHNEAQAIINLIGIDIRMIGNGLPFEVANFSIGDNLLNQAGASSASTITYPILLTSNATRLDYRLNETGSVYMTSADFAFNSTQFYVNLHDVEGLFEGDPVYITNKSITGQEGFWGVIRNNSTGIDAVNKRVLIDVSANGYWVSEVSGFTGFKTGSILEPVSNIRLANTTSGGINFITRQVGSNTPLEIARNATFSLRYFSYTQVDNEITLVQIPTLTAASLINKDLNFIEVTVNVTSPQNLSSIGKVKAPYTASVTQLFAVKNLRTKT